MDFLTNEIRRMPPPTPRPILQHEGHLSETQSPNAIFVSAVEAGYRATGTKLEGSEEDKHARVNQARIHMFRYNYLPGPSQLCV